MKKIKIFLASVLSLLLLGSLIFYFSFKSEITKFFDLYPIIKNFEKDVFTEKYLNNYIYKTQYSIDVLRYDLNVSIDFIEETITGKVHILTAIKDSSLRTIPLNFRGDFQIAKVTYNGVPSKWAYTNNHFLIERKDKKDTATIFIAYKGRPQSLGLGSFTFGELDGEKYCYTINEPVYASTWFPCNDRPDDKALYRISITTDSSKYSISNGKLIKVKKEGGKKTFVWESYYPLASYLVAIYSGKYIELEDSLKIGEQVLPIRHFLFPSEIEDAKEDLRIVKEGLKTFSELFGEYPFLKEKYSVVEIDWPIGGIENQTVSAIGKRFFTGKGFFEDLFIHELAHQWWGNAVTIRNWQDIWLNEGFAVYSTALFDENVYGEGALHSFLNSRRGKFEDATLLDPQEEALSDLTYNKGAWFLHMLRKEMGDEKFFELLKKYFQTFKYKNSSTKELKLLAEKVSQKNLDYFFNQWLAQKGVPIFNISFRSIKSDSSGYTTQLHLEQTGIFKNYKLILPFVFLNKKIKETFEKEVKVNRSSEDFEIALPFFADSLYVNNEDMLVITNIQTE